MDEKNKSKSQTKPQWGFIGAISAAIAASVCCLGPLILVMLGFSGAWIGNLSAFERYRPFFMLITFMFLVYAFYKVYSKPKIGCCETDNDCANPKADKINKIVLWIVTVFVVGMLIAPNVMSCCLFGSFTPKSTATQPVATKRVVLRVEGMTCSACSVTVTKTLERIDGVQKASVIMTPPEAIVIYDPAKVTVKQLTKATKNVGYSTSVKEGN